MTCHRQDTTLRTFTTGAFGDSYSERQIMVEGSRYISVVFLKAKYQKVLDLISVSESFGISFCIFTLSFKHLGSTGFFSQFESI